ncbi:MAG TPA: hypothetical protein VFP69_03745 [Streptomyces sp.]|nr:hypothetical protein [Streptomyces sp.]
MTACAIEPTAQHSEPDDEGTPPTAGCSLSADGAYAARLARVGDGWFPERWTLDGPEPYAVPLPGDRPEPPGTEVQPMGDGRVLVHRPADTRHAFSLLYPTGPGTGELPLGTVERTAGDTRLRLLPPAPGGDRAYALAADRGSSTVWRVAGGAFGPERVAEVPGRCSGGRWLDDSGRLLALDRETGGRTKAVVVDLERGGEVSPLLQIAEDSDDRLLLADPSSGLLLIGSDAPSPGEPRLGWGVLGSALPVRFPESLRVPNCTLTPFAVQPGQVLTPEACAVALLVEGPLGTWVGVWRPAGRQLHHLPAPEGWLAGTGRWTRDGELHLPCSTEGVPCGVARLVAPWDEAGGAGTPGVPGGRRSGAVPLTTAGLRAGVPPRTAAPPPATASAPPTDAAAAVPASPASPAAAFAASGAVADGPVRAPDGPGEPGGPTGMTTGTAAGPGLGGTGAEGSPAHAAARPMPLREAPLGRLVTN